jgi:hypothetical protein
MSLYYNTVLFSHGILMPLALVLACIFIDYNYVITNIITCFLIILGWIINEHCIFIEYENVLKCVYTKDQETCNDCNKPTGITLRTLINMTAFWTFLILTISCLRYIYKFNFFSFSSITNSKLHLTYLLIIVYILLLYLIPCIYHFVKYKNIKQANIYLVYLLLGIYLLYYYIYNSNLQSTFIPLEI